MDRRKFIKTIGVITAGVVLLPTLGFTKEDKLTSYPLRHIGIPLPEELREAHEFMLEQGYYWFNLFGRSNLPDVADYTQSEYLRTFLDTNTKISIRMYHEGEHWMIISPVWNQSVVHRSWTMDVLRKLVYAQERGLIFKSNIYDGCKYTDTFQCRDGSLFSISKQGPTIEPWWEN